MYLNRGGSRILETGGPKSEGEARIAGAKRLRIDGEARENIYYIYYSFIGGGGVWGGCSLSLSPENLWKFKLTTVQFGVYLERHLII